MSSNCNILRIPLLLWCIFIIYPVNSFSQEAEETVAEEKTVPEETVAQEAKEGKKEDSISTALTVEELIAQKAEEARRA